MKKIAITGSLGTGKSTLLKILEELGMPTFSCDEVVKKLYETPEIRKKVIEIFGDEIVEDNERINKRKILEKILENNQLKIRLEALFHPIVKEKILEFIKNNQGKKVVFVEVPLLFEVGWENYFDEVWVVSCSERIQKERIRKKGLDENIAQKLLKLHLPLKEKEKKADKIIFSEKSIEDLKEEIKKMLEEYLKD